MTGDSSLFSLFLGDPGALLVLGALLSRPPLRTVWLALDWTKSGTAPEISGVLLGSALQNGLDRIPYVRRCAFTVTPAL